MLDTLHNRIREARKNTGLSQKKMAEQIGVGRNSYINFERGRTKLFNRCLYRMAEFLGVPEEELLFGRQPDEALLRDQLKKMEDAGIFAVLVPVADKPLDTPDQEEAFINAFNHTARRVKDCESVAGFELAPQLKDKQAFMDTLAKKHAQYVYFTKAENPLSDDIVLY